MRSPSSSQSPAQLDRKYDAAAAGWSDKMRLLGYFDAYLGFLSSDPSAPLDQNALDIGCGTGAFAEARAVIHSSGRISLLEPSAAMLTQAQKSLSARGASAEAIPERLEDYRPTSLHDCLLAAHVLEHCADPVSALQHMRALVVPGAPLWLVVSKPHWCNAIIWLQWRHKSYRPEAVEQMLNAAGWDLKAQHSFPTGPPSRTSRGYRAIAV